MPARCRRDAAATLARAASRADGYIAGMPDGAHSPRPALRGFDFQRVTQDGQSGLALIDRLGLTEGAVFLPDGLVPLVGRMDGTRTIAELRAALTGPGHEPMPPGFIEDLVAQLDERLLLHGPRFDAALRAAADAFLAAGARPPSHAGSAGCPRDPAQLADALEGILGTTTPHRAAARGLIAPHIDLLRGRDGYAQAYGWLAEHEPADLYVLFGTGHGGPSAPVTGLPLDWDTPLGRVATDGAFVAAVHDALGPAAPQDLLLHRGEHSLEFQVLFLRHLLGERPFRVACFMTGYLPSGTGDPGEEEYVHNILDAFRAAAAETSGSVCYIAGADLAHLGPFFGDDAPVDGARLDQLRRDEAERLRHLVAGEPGAFHRAVDADGNPDRVCGASPIFLTAALCGGGGELLHYGQAPATDGSQVVSFCAMGFGAERAGAAAVSDPAGAPSQP